MRPEGLAVGRVKQHLNGSAFHCFFGEAPEVAGRQLVIEHDEQLGRYAMVLDRPVGTVVAQVGRQPGRHRGGSERPSYHSWKTSWSRPSRRRMPNASGWIEYSLASRWKYRDALLGGSS